MPYYSNFSKFKEKKNDINFLRKEFCINYYTKNNMKKYIALSLILLLSLFSLTGCYDSKSVENYAYAVGISLDKSETEDLKLSIQFAESAGNSDSGSSQSTESTLISVDCNSINTGISIINNFSSHTINLAHCSVIVFSEELAKEGIGKYINTFTNDLEVRPTCNVIISESDGYKFLETAASSSEKFSARYYEYILNSSDYTGYTTRTPLWSFFGRIKDDTTNPISILSKTANDNVQNIGLAVFKSDKMVGKISTLDTIFYLILTNELEHATISIPDPNNKDSNLDIYIVLKNNTKNSVKLVNNSPFITSNISIEGKILSSTSNDTDYSKKEALISVENSLKDYLEEYITGFLYTTSKEYNSDICGFGEKLMQTYWTEEEWNKVHWSDIYKNASYDVNVETNISSSYLFTKQ